MLSEALNKVLNEYQDARFQRFRDHPLAKFIRHDIPELLESLVIDPEIYSGDGSAGKGKWTNCPWVAIFDESVTTSAQRGFYPVYLFQETMDGVYLSLNQGITDIKKELGGRQARNELKSCAERYRSQISPIPNQFNLSDIDLQAQSSADIASFYENGNICAAYYPADRLPPDKRLVADFLEMIRLYGKLAGRINMPVAASQIEEDEAGLTYEDLRRVRTHKRLERNQALSKAAKRIHGYVCEACGFDFEAAYGEIGHKFIEAHHLVSVSERAGHLVETDPKNDFAVLCSNCHRMIHRTGNIGDINSFRVLIRRNPT